MDWTVHQWTKSFYIRVRMEENGAVLGRGPPHKGPNPVRDAISQNGPIQGPYLA
jgi:hypothetical protein